jgi:hypothetical protein
MPYVAQRCHTQLFTALSMAMQQGRRTTKQSHAAARLPPPADKGSGSAGIIVMQEPEFVGRLR